MFASATKGEKYMATLIGVDGWPADFEIKARAAPTFEKYLERFGIHPTNDNKKEPPNRWQLDTPRIRRAG